MALLVETATASVVATPASPEVPAFDVPNTVATTDVPGTKTEGIAVASLLETLGSLVEAIYKHFLSSTAQKGVSN